MFLAFLHEFGFTGNEGQVIRDYLRSSPLLLSHDLVVSGALTVAVPPFYLITFDLLILVPRHLEHAKNSAEFQLLFAFNKCTDSLTFNTLSELRIYDTGTYSSSPG